MRSWKPEDSREQRLALAGDDPGEVFGNHPLVDRRPRGIVAGERAGLGGERDALRRLPVAERLDAEMIARAEQPPGASIPDREREIAQQPIDASGAGGAVGAEHDLG